MTDKAWSSDGYVRIPTSALATVQLRHLISEKDLTIAVLGGPAAGATITGITEWVGSWQDTTVSVGWDWGVVDEVVVLLNPNEIRTNIRLVSAEGRVEPQAVARIHLLQWIESMPWQQVAIADLLADGQGVDR